MAIFNRIKLPNSTTYYVVGVGQSNPNLLDNPWFTVNQRGIASGTVESAYIVDRWICNKAHYTVTNSGLEITPTTSGYGLQQKIETSLVNQLENKIVTFSLLDQNNNIYKHTFVYKDNSGYQADFSMENNFSLYLSVHGIWIVGNTNATLHVRAVKLELGSVSTLANDTAPNHAEELLKCQRYFYYSKYDITKITGPAQNAFAAITGFDYYNLIVNVRYPVAMRVTPNVEIRSYDGTPNRISNWVDGSTAPYVCSVNQATHSNQGFNAVSSNSIIPKDAAFEFHVWASADL